MLAAEQSLQEGRLQDALKQLTEQVRKDPANVEHRIFLFQLLALLGEWGRAMNQLRVAGELDAGALAMVQTYREALRCEVLRAEVFAGRRSPLVFGKPEEWLALLMEAARAVGEGRYRESQAVREQAFAAAPATAGSIDGQAFAWIADADARLGPVLEAIVNGRYYWVSFSLIRTIEIEKPTDLRDLVWVPAHFTWSNGGQAVGLIPARYPGSHASNDPQIQMGRKTEWLEQEGGVYLGLGQRMLVTDSAEYPLLEVRSISLGTAGIADG